MKKLLLICVFLLGIVGAGFTQTQEELVKTFTPEEDCYLAVFAVNGFTNVETWDEPTIKVFARIVTPEIGQEALGEIIEGGRYDIEMNFYEEERVIIFDMPKQQEFLTLDGYELEEYLEYKIFVPKEIKVIVVNLQFPTIL